MFFLPSVCHPQQIPFPSFINFDTEWEIVRGEDPLRGYYPFMSCTLETEMGDGVGIVWSVNIFRIRTEQGFVHSRSPPLIIITRMPEIWYLFGEDNGRVRFVTYSAWEDTHHITASVYGDDAVRQFGKLYSRINDRFKPVADGMLKVFEEGAV